MPVFLLATPVIKVPRPTDARIERAYIDALQDSVAPESSGRVLFKPRVQERIEINGRFKSCGDHERPRRKN
jgi:hypothetical protein